MPIITNSTIQKFIDGDMKAFEKIFDEYKDPIYYLCLHYLKNHDDANDCVQEIFLKLIDNIDKFDPSKASFNTWFNTLAKNYTLTFLRNRDYRKNKIILDDIQVEKCECINNIEKTLILEDVKKYLGDEDYLILLYRIGYKMSFQKISEIMNINRETIRLRYKNAISKASKYIS